MGGQDGYGDFKPDLSFVPKVNIDGPLSTALAGHTFEYKYSSGLKYTISFDEDYTYFLNPAGGTGPNGKPYIQLPCKMREIRKDIILVHWVIPFVSGGHVALVLDLERKCVNGSGVGPGGVELFEHAEFTSHWTNGENAVYKLL